MCLYLTGSLCLTVQGWGETFFEAHNRVAGRPRYEWLVGKPEASSFHGEISPVKSASERLSIDLLEACFWITSD